MNDEIGDIEAAYNEWVIKFGDRGVSGIELEQSKVDMNNELKVPYGVFIEMLYRTNDVELMNIYQIKPRDEVKHLFKVKPENNLTTKTNSV